MTYNELRIESLGRLRSISDVENADFEFSTLVCHILGVTKAKLLAMRTELIDSVMLERIREAIERRCAHEPLQYIIGEVGFYRESYLVTPDCLIPRPDTETLVDYAVKNIPEGATFLKSYPAAPDDAGLQRGE